MRHATPFSALAIALLALGFWPRPADAQISRHPTGVNVNAQGATSVFITFGDLDGYVPDEALWCGELVDAAPDVGNRCDPGTIFGSLPLRLNVSRASGQDGFTDIMSIPPSVARRAYQAAAADASVDSRFFYVRRFVDPDGVRPDQYVSVTCRLTGGDARVPFSLLDVRLDFPGEEEVLVVGSGKEIPAFQARIQYNGTGRLIGRWEVVLPGEEPPTSEDLLTEATLPVELRGTQRAYTELQRFNVFLPPDGEFVLPGPDPETLPTEVTGFYQVLLRIEATDDKEGDSDLASAGAGEGLVHSGAVAGFPMPTLSYFAGAGAAEAAAGTGFRLLAPTSGSELARSGPLDLRWAPSSRAVVYRVEVETTGSDPLLSALVEAPATLYRAPTWLSERADGAAIRWRVVGLGADGGAVRATPWRTHRWEGE